MLSSAALRRLPVIAVIVLAWAALAVMALQHPGHGLHAMHPVPLGWMDFALLSFMWWAMAVAMMLPTAIPALDTLEELSDTARRRGETPGRTLFFVLGFVAVWCAFGFIAALLQWQLHAEGAGARFRPRVGFRRPQRRTLRYQLVRAGAFLSRPRRAPTTGNRRGAG